jgi:hypothetical protein
VLRWCIDPSVRVEVELAPLGKLRFGCARRREHCEVEATRRHAIGLTSTSAASSAGGPIDSIGAPHSAAGTWFAKLLIRRAACLGVRLGSITRSWWSWSQRARVQRSRSVAACAAASASRARGVALGERRGSRAHSATARARRAQQRARR